MHRDIIIVGGGVAGISCASQLAMYGHAPLIIERDTLGGLVRYAGKVFNTPVFCNDTTGEDIVMHLQNAVDFFNISVAYDNIASVECDNGLIKLISNKHIYSCSDLIIATGTDPVNPFSFALPDNSNWSFYPPPNCIDIDSVIIVGGGDIALDYALTMRKHVSSIIIISRSALKANDFLINEVRKSNISVFEYQHIRSVNGNKHIQIITSEQIFSADHLLIAAGRRVTMPHIHEDCQSQCNIHKAVNQNDKHNMIVSAAARGTNCAINIISRRRTWNPKNSTQIQ